MFTRLNDKSRMKREFHVRFCESLEGRFLGATRQLVDSNTNEVEYINRHGFGSGSHTLCRSGGTGIELGWTSEWVLHQKNVMSASGNGFSRC